MFEFNRELNQNVNQKNKKRFSNKLAECHMPTVAILSETFRLSLGFFSRLNTRAQQLRSRFKSTHVMIGCQFDGQKSTKKNKESKNDNQSVYLLTFCIKHELEHLYG